MAATLAADNSPLLSQSDLMSSEDTDQNDPFLSASTSSNHHRFSHFDSQLFALGPTTSPEQAKRALEAHLAETERRIQEASKLGTNLVQQRKDLTERLKDVEKQQSEGDITPELRQKLIEIEKEFNEVGRESARAFLPKSRVSSSEIAGSPFAGDGKRNISPSKFESQATNSPSKLTVPTRKQRNQPSNRVHDIEFATEISTSLLSQVRHLQALLAEKDEALKTVTYEKSRLEIEAEGFNQRLRTLDESEHRYKDENWNLETQIHEFMAAAKDAADREKKLTQSLNIAQAEKNSVQKELDEIKLNHTKLAEDHAAALKHHDVELGTVKRNMTLAETERNALQRKVEDLTGQNQELAKAIAHQRGRLEDRDQATGLSDDDFETATDNVTPEHSPPPSPIKGTPRHSMLESETLKSSLHHAHRMIQNLKGNIHREKTEKLELKRMLQDARDELEARRNESGLGPGSGKKNRKVESREFKKPLKPGQLGGLRTSRSEVLIDETNWEEDNGQGSPTHSAARTSVRVPATDHTDTANEGTDDFETANERATETEDFQTGQEDMSGSDDLTETEAGPSGTTRKKSPPLSLSKVGNRQSFQSTASTSGDEFNYDDVKTPTTQPQRLRLKLNRGGSRRSKAASDEPTFQSSPPSFANSSNNGTPQVGKSLFAELGDMGGSDDESMEGTPSRSLYASQPATPASRPSTAKGTPAPVAASPGIPKLPMVDSGMMTESWEPAPATPKSALSVIAEPSLVGVSLTGAANLMSDKHVSVGSQTTDTTTDAASQWLDPPQGDVSQGDIGPLSTSTYSDSSSQYDPAIMDEKLAKPSIPSIVEEPTAVPPQLTISGIVAEHVEPVDLEIEAVPDEPKQVAPVPILPPLALSIIQSVHTEPISPRSPRRNGMLLTQAESDKDTENDAEAPETPKPSLLGSVFGWSKGKSTTAPIIAEDETRQSPSESPAAHIPESRQPFKELSANTNERAVKKLFETNDESAQTSLTSEQIDELFRSKKQSTILGEDSQKPTSPRPRRSQESIGSVGRSRAKTTDAELSHETVLHKKHNSRNGSVSSVHPPLPTDHKQVIAAAAQRTGSSSGVVGNMGPPLLPASAYKINSSFRPKTPTSQTPTSPVQGGTTPRAVQSSRSEVQSPTGTGRSRGSSVSSFVSEMDARFNIRAGVVVPNGIDLGTDPRMINAITQTMIGEYLWKYTRKAGRGSMSENRHRRYFWVHPYTRTLYWSDHDPQHAGRSELKAKSVPIEAVRVVTDDNPMPPGLHRKSLVVMTPGRDVKFTASTGQRHETWFNALSYLLLRTGEETAGDTAEVATGLTREDVDEFNPGFRNSKTRRGPTSLYSYNSRTTRNESPRRSTRASVQPSTVHNSTSSRQSMGTLSRLSTYLMSGNAQTATQSSRRGRRSVGGGGSIYEASEVHDSAEDLREMIEKQDRESDKLEDVRACCDGKHHVGHLHSSTKGRHSHNFVTGTASTSQRHSQPRQPSRNSIMRRTE